jgi:hypothetical protein
MGTTERAVKKIHRNEDGRVDSSRMMDELRHYLHDMAETARELSETLGKGEMRLTGRKKDVVESAIDSKMKGLLKEARFFALNDDPENFRSDMEMVMDWMEMKADI